MDVSRLTVPNTYEMEVELWTQAGLIAFWEDELVFAGATGPLKGWTWLRRPGPCELCGSDCIAVDPAGAIRHPVHARPPRDHS